MALLYILSFPSQTLNFESTQVCLKEQRKMFIVLTRSLDPKNRAQLYLALVKNNISYIKISFNVFIH